MTNREIAIKAFDYLYGKGLNESAEKLLDCLNNSTYICLGVGDIDWEIEMAIQRFGGQVKVNNVGYMAKFYF